MVETLNAIRRSYKGLFLFISRFLELDDVPRALVKVLQLSDTHQSNAAPLIICSYILSCLTLYLIFWTRPMGCSAE